MLFTAHVGKLWNMQTKFCMAVIIAKSLEKHLFVYCFFKRMIRPCLKYRPSH